MRVPDLACGEVLRTGPELSPADGQTKRQIRRMGTGVGVSMMFVSHCDSVRGKGPEDGAIRARGRRAKGRKEEGLGDGQQQATSKNVEHEARLPGDVFGIDHAGAGTAGTTRRRGRCASCVNIRADADAQSIGDLCTGHAS